MRNLIIVGVAVIAIALFSKSETQSAETRIPKDAIFVLFENGGTVSASDQENMRHTMLNLLQQITKLSRRKATRDIDVHIVLSAEPNRIAWSGTPMQLLEEREDVTELLSFTNGFSDLVLAFQQIQTTTELTGVDKLKLYWIGPTVQVGFQDAGSEIVVKVPQEVPKNLALAAIAPKLDTLKIYGVHPDQDPMLNIYLMSQGILNRARKGTLRFALYGAAQTNSNIHNLL